MNEYNHLEIDKKWQDFWVENKTFKAEIDNNKEKYYILDMFPYPSGSGLHVGHLEGYTATDILSRLKRMQGFNVLHPIGWDAFGLPAENYAIKTGTHPRISTDANINTFRRQIQETGFSYDWDREIDTTDPKYFEWSQWIFLKLFEEGLAYERKMPMSWCTECKIVVANEEVEGGVHERCGTEVERKEMTQWMLKITEYADRLIEDLELLDWPHKIKAMQENWIGKSEGAEVDFVVEDLGKLRVYTTRPDTLFGCTYMVIAPEHPMVEKILETSSDTKIKEYVKTALNKSERERKQDEKEKTGVFSGVYAINPVNGEKVPVWIADYVLINYGTGAIMAVPAHDERDNEFAKKFGLEIIDVVEGKPKSNGIVLNGKSKNSDFLNGLKTKEAKSKMIEWLEENKVGEKKTNYKLRDWIFTRQRYWGEPIPLVHCEKCGIVPVDESELPLKLPEVEKYEPSGTGESPLAVIEDWVNTSCPKCGIPAKRETSTMPNWAGSSWYWLRYMDPKCDNSPVSKEAEQYWGPVDLYVGGAEHAVLHLLYARFWHKFLYDIDVVSSKEPFQKLRNQGMILGENNEKMSKSRGNVVNPDDVIKIHGSDAIRMYEMFMGPFDQDVSWDMNGVQGVRRFLERVWRLQEKIVENEAENLESIINKTIKKVTQDTEEFKFNTAISAMMVLVNEFFRHNKINKSDYEILIKLLNPYAPHLTEEIWQMLGNKEILAYEKWPKFKEELCVENTIKIGVQVNGKVRGDMEITKDMPKHEVLEKAKQIESVKKYLENGIKKEIYVPGRLVSLVV